MQFSKIPTFKLEEKHQKELLEALDSLSKQWKAFYNDEYNQIKKIRAAINCRNYEKPVKVMHNEKDSEKTKAPDIHIPNLKIASTIGIRELENALFDGDYLQATASDDQHKELEKVVKKAMYSIIHQTGTDNKYIQILENLWNEGTCPTVITNEGRINATHEIVYRHEIPITDENIELVQQLVYNQATAELQEKDIYGLFDINLQDVGTKIIYKMEDVEQDGVQFNQTTIKTDTDLLIEDFVDDDDTEETSLDLAEKYLMEVGIDLSSKEEIPEDIKTVEEWIEGLPRPKVLNILECFIEPAASNEDPDTITVLYEAYRKTQELFECPDFIDENKEKLKQENESDKFIGTTNISVYEKKEDQKSSYTALDPHVIFRQAYFHQFRFKDGKTLRNFIVSTADNKVLLEVKPNVSYTEINGRKISKNPFIIHRYYNPSGTNIGRSPAMDMISLSEAINKLFNYGLDKISRDGNRWAVEKSVELDSMGGGGSLFRVNFASPTYRQLGISNINNLIQEFPSNPTVIQTAFSPIASLEAKMNQASNTSQSYFNDRDDQTATEIATVTNQAGGTIKSIVRNIAKTINDMHQRMFEDCVNRGVVVNVVCTVDDKDSEQIIQSIYFSQFRGKKFTFGLSSLNPELTKGIMAKILTETLTNALQSQHPEILSRINISEFVQEILSLRGINNSKLIRDDKEAKQWMQMNDLKEQIFGAYQNGLLIPNPAIQEGGPAQAGGPQPDSLQPVAG